MIKFVKKKERKDDFRWKIKKQKTLKPAWFYTHTHTHTGVLENNKKNSSVQENRKGVEIQNVKYVRILKNVGKARSFKKERNGEFGEKLEKDKEKSWLTQRNAERNWQKQKAGITLIALVITIIVLIILASASISMLIGDEGILTKAGSAEEEIRGASIQEEEQMWNLKNYYNKETGSTDDVESRDEILNRLYSKGILTQEEYHDLKNNIGVSIGSHYIQFANTNKYSVGVDESEIIEDLFNFDVSEDGEKYAIITSMNANFVDTSTYEVVYNGTKITRLIIPYEVKLSNVDGKWVVDNENGEVYTVKEASPFINRAVGCSSGHVYPYVSNVIYPNSVEVIGSISLQNETIKSIILPENLKEIPDSAFIALSKLESIIIPDGVEKIGELAFGNCKSLKKVEISNSVISIEVQAFLNCESLTEIKLPDNLESIGSEAFAYAGLTEVYIPNSVINVNKMAFCGCEQLTKAYIPEAVKGMGDYVFNKCSDDLTVYCAASKKDNTWSALWNKNYSDLTDVNVEWNAKW